MSKLTLVNGQNVDFSLDAQTSGTGTMKTPDLGGATKYQVPAASAAHAAEIAKLGVHGADIASATTTNLETATGELVDVTGTTAITAITLSEGHRRIVRFTGILTLTHGASLVLPGAANITTAAGDVAVFEGYASSVVRCVGYMRAASAPWNASANGAALVAAANYAAMRLLLGAPTVRVNDAAVTNPSGTAHLDATHQQAVLSGETWRVQIDGLFYPLDADVLVFINGPAADFVCDTGWTQTASALAPAASGLALPTAEIGVGSQAIGFLAFQLVITAKFSAGGTFGLYWKSATNGDDVSIAPGTTSIWTRL